MLADAAPFVRSSNSRRLACARALRFYEIGRCAGDVDPAALFGRDERGCGILRGNGCPGLAESRNARLYDVAMAGGRSVEDHRACQPTYALHLQAVASTPRLTNSFFYRAGESATDRRLTSCRLPCPRSRNQFVLDHIVELGRYDNLPPTTRRATRRAILEGAGAFREVLPRLTASATSRLPAAQTAS